MPKVIPHEQVIFTQGAAWATKLFASALSQAIQKYPGNHEAQVGMVVTCAEGIIEALKEEAEARFPAYDQPDPVPKPYPGGV